MKNKDNFFTEKAFCAILVIFYVISGVYFAVKGAYASISILLFCVLFTLAMYVLHVKFTALVSKNIYITACAFVLFASCLGSCYGFYDLIKWYDDFLHLWSGIMCAQIGFSLAVYLWDFGDVTGKKRVFILLFVFFFTMGIASLWEIYEFIADSFFGLNMQVGGLTDTCMDMIDALIGGVLSLPFINRMIKRINIKI